MKLVTLTCLLFISAISMATGTASFSCDVTHGCSPLLVHMTDHSTGATTWRWNLGNGNTSTQQNPSATYSAPGIYHVTLVTTIGARTDSATQIIVVNGIPSIDFAASRNTACIGDSIGFSAVISTAGSAPIDHYAWNLGNGTGSSLMNTSYRYSQSGLYDITLVARDTNGCTSSLTKPAYIRIWPSPVANFSVTPAISCGTSQVVTFADQSQGTGLSYALAYGDGGTATTANTTHTYSYGRYNSRLTVTSANGCSASAVKGIAVINLGANFRADKQTVCTGEQVTFENLSP
ncbi:MAG: PKD domain-containing protein, partial [Bacteroidetes bacterium]|nr:PKD domain-containing protein [Bacteroidota bacterium]